MPMASFAIGDKVLIRGSKQLGYICDDIDREKGHYIVDCYDFMNTDNPNKYLIDVDEKNIEKVIA